MSFPKGFVWGAAAASYQIEGGAYDDGKGDSVWDMFCRHPGYVFQGNTGDVACDHYHRYREDVDLMADLGLHAYRLSISWPRVLPEGVGRINRKGLDFYDRLIDCLLAKQIQPWVTLFHWDYPLALYRLGGWLNPSSSDWFAEYTGLIMDALSDRVAHWITLNEPQVFVHHGHVEGGHAPGQKYGDEDVFRVLHNVLLSHGKSVQVIRAKAKKKPFVGISMASTTRIPVSDDPKDIEVAMSEMALATGRPWTSNVWYGDPIVFGKYPEEGVKKYEQQMPDVKDSDMAIVHQPLDFYGTNNYFSTMVKAGQDGTAGQVNMPDGHALTSVPWPVQPDTLYWSAKFLYERYKLPIYVTENGMANTDWIHLDGKCHDPQRIDFLARYLTGYKRAIDEGVDARGYFVWSIMDNFEWSLGYSKRFGIIFVDYQTGKRTLKDSAHWYKDVIASNGELIGD